jgi:Protein of unknown function (DUF3563)
MNPITRFLDWLFEPGHLADQRHEEAYLAQSVDIYDLERRMRQLDRRVAFGATEPALAY